MTNTNLVDLFHLHRFSTKFGLFQTLLYLPVGLCVLALRLLIGVQTLFIITCYPESLAGKRFILRILYGVLGIIVTTKNSLHRDPKVKIFVSNFTTFLDHAALKTVFVHTLPNVWDMPVLLAWLLGYSNFGAEKGREVLENNIKKHLLESNTPVLVFPEGTTTSGEVGLLKFSIWPFSIEHPIQPICIKIHRAFDVNPCTLHSHWWSDILWLLFVPYTRFHISVLPPMAKTENETAEDFSLRVQSLMAASLLVIPTMYSSSDKAELIKLKPEVPRQLSGNQSERSSLQDLVRQVKNVLPQVSTDVIINDLALTKDVDLTITNILEGRIKSDLKPESSVSFSSAVYNRQQLHCLSPSTINKQLTLSERKAALISFARQRYLEKHSLD